jgi:hypothetical protein
MYVIENLSLQVCPVLKVLQELTAETPPKVNEVQKANRDSQFQVILAGPDCQALMACLAERVTWDCRVHEDHLETHQMLSTAELELQEGKVIVVNLVVMDMLVNLDNLEKKVTFSDPAFGFVRICPFVFPDVVTLRYQKTTRGSCAE